ncbi:MAG: hypothetical protein K8I29_02970 [Alphaproteobacteria bacterium]|uniref:Uncharacterized protein n=1 Tax=Candidatus Nitrobium versatile TaxID=2884831 RepID=A0A953M0G5_9BACT|nr:hypothetical protein [Candidatus Nitrobium versatile]
MLTFAGVLTIGIILFALAILFAFIAFKGSIEEVQLTRSLSEEDQKIVTDETVRDSPWIAILGAAIAGFTAAVIVGLYGVAPGYLYLGPLAALAATVGTTVCFFSDIRDKNEIRKRLVRRLHQVEKECAVPQSPSAEAK